MYRPITIKGVQYLQGITHNTKFHSDDVCAAALLQCLVKLQNDDADAEFLVTRCDAKTAREMYENNDNIIVFDIADSQYDHHKTPREKRPNGIAYASFGKLWRDVGIEMGFDENHIGFFDRDFVQTIDLHDNEGIGNPFSYCIANMNSDNLNDETMQYRCFQRAVEWAFTGLINSMTDLFLRQEESVAIRHDGNIITRDKDDLTAVVYDKYMKSFWVEDIRKEHVMIYPHARGGWSIQCLCDKDANGIRVQRVLAPLEYRGREKEDLEKMFHGMKFCHASGFLMTFEEKDQAIEFFRTVDWLRNAEVFETQKNWKSSIF